jgi:hypothetical protein
VTAGLTGRHARACGLLATPAPTDVWDDVVASAPNALPSQSPTWMRCLCAVDRYRDASRIYHAADGRRLVLPLARRRAPTPALAARAGLPMGWGPGGLLGELGIVEPEDVRMVVADLTRQPALRIQIRPDPATAAIWEAEMPADVPREPRMSQTVALDGGFDTVWRSAFRKDARNRVRRAERAGVVVERDDTGRLVPVFQELYAKSVDRWARRDGIPLMLARTLAARREPDRKLSTVAALLGPRCRIYAAFLDGRPIAAIVVLLASRTAAYWRGAMDEDVAGRTHANYLLQRTAIQDAAAAGCAVYHMGDSAPGSSLALFKSRFGAAEQHYAVYHLGRGPTNLLPIRMRGAARSLLRVRVREEQAHGRVGRK